MLPHAYFAAGDDDIHAAAVAQHIAATARAAGEPVTLDLMDGGHNFVFVERALRLEFGHLADDVLSAATTKQA